MKTKYVFLTLFLAALLILISLLALRHFNHYPTLHSPEAYTHLRIAQLIHENGILQFDSLLKQHYTFNLYDYLIAGLSLLAPLSLLSLLIPLLIGVAVAFLFYQILIKYCNSERTFYILFFFLLSPAYLYSFTTLTSLGFIAFLALLGFWLFLKQKMIWAYLTWALLVLTSWVAFITICLLFLWYLYTYEKNKIQSALHLFSLGFLFWILLIVTHPFNFQDQLLPFQLGLRYYLTDFGAMVGYSFVTFILCLIWLFKYWNKKPLVLLLVFLLSAINLPTRILMSFMLSIGAGLYVANLSERNWQLSLLKQLTLLLIGCLILFSALSYMHRLVQSPPELSLQKALEKLSYEEKGAVLTSPEYSSFTAYFAHQSLANLSQQDLSTIYHSQRLDLTKKILDQYDVRYILITPSMRNGGVWNAPNQGLLLLLPFSESFIKRNAVDDIEIWQYRGGS
ncbi:MAG TPA: hypothetical protein VJG90_05645 [Candidatus Nanoarchaeia archaeon]|nr:hypothetical protein [Candidatus Nanoarchaeia archaeon]